LVFKKGDTFVVPEKRIHNAESFGKWKESHAYTAYMDFVMKCNESVMGKKVSDLPDSSLSSEVRSVIRLLDELLKWVEEIPLEEQTGRFGNGAFRTWHRRLTENSESLLWEYLLPEGPLRGSSIELKTYLEDSFGNATRIDYGTGHEAAFTAFLCCLYRLDILKDDDCASIVLHAFQRYLYVTRTLQSTYHQEPAGSHGVWGLDDFQFLPFLWGAAQLRGGQRRIIPSDILTESLAREFAPEYLYFDGIRMINEFKKGPFLEHSPMLSSISSVATWDKTNTGMIKMYVAEVLGKFPVIQHFFFGNILPFVPLVLEIPVDPADVQH
jgi:serine/threonine-protein phosphatase 2A activator